ncbi:DUF4167 domain-containing protein [Defluviimonas sp. WL0050]|uniref:DUF4167 domain-containing protein n=1 Tax=Albidovulum litorale TaxID=2984134 RepID=A0ABT2ZI89_9RHOB|nr:DUF4167 domain-containing protein [Defluviimonas sp. WL0050]MCV2870836.1 DUF4167 domain-containing protein [Defluviimonas sp. WL0050]
MRSSKNRSRSKSNRQRSLGNVVNRVFDSSGPEGKVRGTPQQIIDKYLTLARDAQLSNDRVAEQNFLQHAEHYTRMLGEAQKEMQREQEARQAQGGQNQGDGNNHGGQNNDRQNQRHRHDDRSDRDGNEQPRADMSAGRDEDGDEGPGLVETPEARQTARSAPMMPELPAAPEEGSAPTEKKRAQRAPRKPREKRDVAKAPSDGGSEPPADAAE